MPHPGRMIYSHPPKTDGLRYFYMIVHRRRRACELKAANMKREELLVEKSVFDMLDLLDEHAVEGAWWDEEISHRAARALEDYMVRREWIE